MPKLSRKKFERIVASGVAAIPGKFLEKLDNVSIVIENEPTADQKKELGLGRNWTLFGLYEGVPQAERGVDYSIVLPDKITIFQRPIEEASGDEKEMEEIVRDTVWHEIAHHFGLDENEVGAAEERKAGKRKGNS